MAKYALAVKHTIEQNKVNIAHQVLGG